MTILCTGNRAVNKAGEISYPHWVDSPMRKKSNKINIEGARWWWVLWNKMKQARVILYAREEAINVKERGHQGYTF